MWASEQNVTSLQRSNLFKREVDSVFTSVMLDAQTQSELDGKCFPDFKSEDVDCIIITFTLK